MSNTGVRISQIFVFPISLSETMCEWNKQAFGTFSIQTVFFFYVFRYYKLKNSQERYKLRHYK